MLALTHPYFRLNSKATPTYVYSGPLMAMKAGSWFQPKQLDSDMAYQKMVPCRRQWCAIMLILTIKFGYGQSGWDNVGIYTISQ